MVWTAVVPRVEHHTSLPLEDLIRELCAKAVNAPQCDVEPILAELRIALSEHTDHLRQLAAEALVGAVPNQMDISTRF